MAGPLRVLVADDNALVRRGLSDLLRAAGLDVVATAEDGQRAVEEAARARPDVVLMDLSMPALDGVSATARIVAADPAARVVVLTSNGEHEAVHAALSAGAIGYLLKEAEPEEVVRGVRAAAEGGSPFSPSAAAALVQRASSLRAADRLTERERAVLVLVAQGLANKQVARRLGIAEKTVKTHLTSVYATIGVADRTQAALWAQRHGLVD